MSSNKVVIYHDNCPDGHCAAWIFWHRDREREFIPAAHYEAPPDVTGKDVVIVDFSYHKDILLEMKAKANSLIVLDHHLSAEKELHGLDFCTFDMKQSGAGLAWGHEFGGEPPPLVKYIQDRDLYAFKFPYTKEYGLAVDSHPRTFEEWEKLYNTPEGELLTAGKYILQYQEQLVNKIIAHKHFVKIAGQVVPAANTSILQSEVANKLSEGYLFGAAYYRGKNGKVTVSLRVGENTSLRPDGTLCDVSDIAVIYGGGGHARAAGFAVNEMEFIKNEH